MSKRMIRVEKLVGMKNAHKQIKDPGLSAEVFKFLWIASGLASLAMTCLRLTPSCSYRSHSHPGS